MNGSKTIRIMTYNVHRCTGLDGVISPARIADVIAEYKPDIVALQELDVRRARTQRVDQPHAIAERLAMKFHFHPAIEVREERYGDAVLSPHPMKLVHARALPALKFGLGMFEKRGALWVAIRVDDCLMQVINTHLSLYPPEQRLQAKAILGEDWVQNPKWHAPAVVCGDFNAPPTSVVYRLFCGVFRDAQRAYSLRRPRSTFPTRRPLTRIDHIFLTPELQVQKVEVPRTPLTRVASDHLPLIVDVTPP